HVRHLRPRHDPLRRAGARRLPSRTRVFEGAHVNARLTRLAERLDEPLLVTEPTNVVYLTGFASSNAALLVKRDLVGELARLLSGRIAFERSLSYGSYERLRDGGLDLVPTSGLVESLRAV